MTDLSKQLKGAPISWGLCEAPHWGRYQMPTDRILREMVQAGMTGTEMGPPGFLPEDGYEARDLLDQYGLTMAGAFHPVVLHSRDFEAEWAKVKDAFTRLYAAGGTKLILAAATGLEGYGLRPELSLDEWYRMVERLNMIVGRLQDHGIDPCLHPHMGTMIERPKEIRQVLDLSWIGLCLDTGHIAAAGGNPLDLARDYTHRINHVHLKDARSALGARVMAEGRDYVSAIREGMFAPLGQGDARIQEVVTYLHQAGYDGDYVLEQDVVIDDEPAEGQGPIVQVVESVEFLCSTLEAA